MRSIEDFARFTARISVLSSPMQQRAAIVRALDEQVLGVIMSIEVSRNKQCSLEVKRLNQVLLEAFDTESKYRFLHQKASSELRRLEQQVSTQLAEQDEDFIESSMAELDEHAKYMADERVAVIEREQALNWRHEHMCQKLLAWISHKVELCKSILIRVQEAQQTLIDMAE